MDIKAAIKKAYSLQSLVGTTQKDLCVEAIIPAPSAGSLAFNEFIDEFKIRAIQNRFEEINFEDIAECSNAGSDFDVYVLYEGSLHESVLNMSGNTFYEKVD